jgi:hypothetical protein
MNAFNPDSMKTEEIEELAKDLIEESETLHNYKTRSIEHKNPLLKKFFYVFSSGLHKQDGSRDEETVNIYKERAGAAMKALQGEPAEPLIKIEKSESCIALRSKVTVLKAAKTALSKLHEDVEQTVVELVSKKDTVNAQELNTKAVVLADFIKDVRQSIVDNDKADLSDEECQEKLKQVKTLLGDANEHLKAGKASLKNFRKLLL